MNRIRRYRLMVRALEDRLAPAGLVSPPINYGRIDPALVSLFEQSTRGAVVTGASPLAMDINGQRVSVSLTANVNQVLPQLNALDFHIAGARPEYSLIAGDMPIANIMKLDSLSGFMNARVNYKGSPDVGLVTSQAAQTHGSLRANFMTPTKYDGTGVKVGVLSDSFNAKGGAQTDVNNNDLPSGITYYNDDPGGTDEGRAMSQLIHDIAPGAQIAFEAVPNDEMTYADRINNLAVNFGAKIIVDDVTLYSEPFFQDGIVAQKIADLVTNKNLLYFASAGNRARQGYETTNFNASPDSGGLFSGTWHDFDPGPGVDTRQLITVPAQGGIILNLQWDDAFYNPTAVATDLDILLVQPGTTISLGTDGNTNNLNSSTPYELVGYTNPSMTNSVQFEVMIRRRNGTANPGRIKYVNYFSDIVTTSEFATNSPTINSHAGSGSVIAVAAAPYYNQQTPEAFTSVGPVTRLFSPDGKTRLATPELRDKPDMTAHDDCNTSFFYSPNNPDGDGFWNFNGTSAAAPNAAAVAALLVQKYPAATNVFINNTMRSKASDIGTPGNDMVTGVGLINAYNALFGEAAPAALGLVDGFEAAALGVNWDIGSTGNGRVRITGDGGPLSGSQHMMMDAFFNAGVNSLNEAVLHINGTALDVTLNFSARSYDDGPNSMPASFLGSQNYDGVAFSVDGVTWYRLVNGSSIPNYYQPYSFDLMAEAAKVGVTLSSNTRIKFQQYDSRAWDTPGGSDGLAFDNVSVVSQNTPDNFWTGLGDGVNWNSVGNWSSGIPTAADDVVINSTTPVIASGYGIVTRSLFSNAPITLNGNWSMDGLAMLNAPFTLLNGDLLGNGTITVNKGMNWEGGAMYSASPDTARLVIPAGAEMKILTNNVHTLSYGSNPGRRIQNSGTVTWVDAGPISCSSGGMFNNLPGSTFNYNGTGSWSGSAELNFSNCNLVINSGSMTMNSPISIYNSMALTGNLNIASNTTSLFSAVVTGTGNIRVSGGTLLAPASLTSTADHVVLDGGVIHGDGVLNIAKSLVWNSGSIHSISAGAGKLVINNTGIMTIATGNVHYLGYGSTPGREVINNGLVLWTGGSVSSTSGTWTNAPGSTFDFRTPDVWTGGHRMISSGTLMRSTGLGVATMHVPMDLNAATLQIDSGWLQFNGGGEWQGTQHLDGGQLALIGGTFNLAKNTSVTGAGTLNVAGSAYLNAPASGEDAYLNHLVLSPGGNISGPGHLFVESSMEWTGGALYDGGTGGDLTIYSNATFKVHGNDVHYLGYGANNSRTILNQGKATWIDNGAISTTGSGSWQNLPGSSFTYSGGGGWSGSVPLKFTNSTLIVTSPSFVMPSPISFAGSMGLVGNVQTVGNMTLENGLSISGSGTLEVAGGVANVLAAASVQRFSVTDGSVNGDGILTITEAMDWIGGSLYSNNANVGKIIIPVGSTLNIKSNNVHYLGYGSTPPRLIENSGTVTWSDAGPISTQSGKFENLAGSKFNFTGTGGWGGGVELNFTNCTLNVNAPVFNMSTPVYVTGGLTLTGTLQMTSSTLTMHPGAAIGGAGTLALAGGVLQVPAAAGLLRLDMFDGAILGPGNLDVLDTMNWTAGSLHAVSPGVGKLSIAAGAAMNIISANAHTIGYGSTPGRDIDNSGTVTWNAGPISTTTGNFNNLPGSTLIVNANNFTWSGGERVIVSGNLQRTATGTATISCPFDAQGMTADVTPGGINLGGGGTWAKANVMKAGDLNLTYGLFDFNNGAAITGAGTIRIAGGLVNVPTAASVFVERWAMSDGGIVGDGKATVTSSFDWTGGSLHSATSETGKLVINPTAVMSISSNNVHYLGYGSTPARLIENSGTVTWSDAGPISTQAGRFENLAGSKFNYSGTGGWGGGVALNFTDCGINVTAPVFNMATPVNLNGAINLTGILQLPGSVMTLANGSVVSGTGSISVAGGLLSVPAAASVPSLLMYDGAIVGDGALTIVYDMSWFYGSVHSNTSNTGTLVIQNGATLNIGATNAHYLGYGSTPGRTIVNNGVVNWTDGVISTSYGALFINQPGGVFNLQSASAWGGGVEIQNNGILRRNLNAGATSISSKLTNTGTVEALSGTLLITNMEQTAGMTKVNAELSVAGGLQLNGGTLVGTGTVSGGVNNAGGTVSPGNSSGLLTINGNYIQASTLKMEINGTNAGQFDQLAVNGNVSLGGTLNVVPAYAAKVGDSFVILANDNADAIIGNFAGLSEGGKFTSGGVEFQISYAGGTGNDVSLTVTKVNPPPTATIAIDDGSAQRSMVRNFDFTFSEPVTIANPAAAFTLQRTGPGGPNGFVTLSFNITPTAVTITFNDSQYAPGNAKSLIDGNYTLTVYGGEITANGLALDADNDGLAGGNRDLMTHRLFGDINGDRTVSANDFIAFRLALGGNNFAFDFDGDGSVSASDFIQFRLRFGGSI